MKFAPAQPALTGETLDSLTTRLRERGEPAFRAKQILDWVYKKRVRSWDDMTNLPKALRALAGPDLRPPARGARPQQAVGRCHRQAPSQAGGPLADRDRHHPRPPGRGGHRPLAQDDLHLHPGRLRHGLRLLRQRAGRAEARPLGGRDRRAAPAGLLSGGCAHAAGPGGARLLRQHRGDGHGRAAGQLRRPADRADDRQRRVGPGLRRAPDHDLDQRPGAEDPAAGRRADRLPAGDLPPRRHRRGPRKDHAGRTRPIRWPSSCRR